MIQDKLICICLLTLLLQIFNMSHYDKKYNNVYKTIWKNENKEYNEKYICYPVLSRTSVYFAFSKLILLFSYSFHVPCIILSNVYFYILRSMFLFLLNRSQPKTCVVNQMSHLFFEAQK